MFRQAAIAARRRVGFGTLRMAIRETFQRPCMFRVICRVAVKSRLEVKLQGPKDTAFTVNITTTPRPLKRRATQAWFLLQAASAESCANNLLRTVHKSSETDATNYSAFQKDFS